VAVPRMIGAIAASGPSSRGSSGSSGSSGNSCAADGAGREAALGRTAFQVGFAQPVRKECETQLP
jgi:hypothetical protein